MKRRLYLLLFELARGVFVPGGREGLSSPPVPDCSSAVADETNCNPVPEQRKSAGKCENTMRAPLALKQGGGTVLVLLHPSL